MLSEFENNLDAEVPILIDRRGRRISISKTKNILNNHGIHDTIKEIAEDDHHCPNHLHPNSRSNANNKNNSSSHSNPPCSNTLCPAKVDLNSSGNHQQHNNHHSKWRPSSNTFLNNRMISVIDEASV